MKPDWDKLMDEFKGHPSALIADVDCTADGKSLCEKHGVSGYPTIKYGDPGDLKAYEGGRTFDDLKKFAETNLGPSCDPDHLDLCKEDAKQKIEGYLKMSLGKLEGKINKAEKTLADAQKVVEEEVPMMKKVVAHLKKGKKSEL